LNSLRARVGPLEFFEKRVLALKKAETHWFKTALETNDEFQRVSQTYVDGCSGWVSENAKTFASLIQLEVLSIFEFFPGGIFRKREIFMKLHHSL